MSLPNTHFGAEQISRILDGPKTIFFAGIGGVSMSSLAHISHLRGHTILGYDRTPSPLTAQLEEMGIQIRYTSDADNLQNADLLVYTVAIPADQPEYVEAKRRGIPVISRADYLGYIMCGYQTRIGVCGMHGKSTTTSMLASVFRTAGTDPTVSCGAPMKDAGGRCDLIGKEDFFIFEACEYMDSFLDFYPTDVLVLNIEMDHPDYFHSMEQIESSFARFLARTGDGGTAYLNLQNENVMRAARGYKGRTVTYGVNCPGADYSAQNIVVSHGFPSFDLVRRGETLCRIQLQVPGEHNICDALGAAAVAVENGISPTAAAAGLGEFQGPGRRMDFRGLTAAGARVYDDYAHHPTEIASTIRAAAAMDHRKLYCVFQPHTYSRTRELFDSFAAVLADHSLSEVILADIYPARETDTLGVSSQILCEAVNKRGGNCRAASSFAEIAQWILDECEEDDIVLVMGAGDVNQLCPLLLK